LADISTVDPAAHAMKDAEIEDFVEGFRGAIGIDPRSIFKPPEGRLPGSS
jgi:hypothetical protein